jgi:hypothetical protein
MDQHSGQGPNSDSEYESIVSIRTGDPGSPQRPTSAPIPIPAGHMRITKLDNDGGTTFVEVNRADFASYGDGNAGDDSSDSGAAVAAVAAVVARGPRRPEGRRHLVDYGSDTSGRHEFVEVTRDICL